MKLGAKGCVGLVVIAVLTLFIILVIGSMFEKTPTAQMADFNRPTFIKERTPGCQLIEQWPSDLDRCPMFDPQRVEVLQIGHDGKLLRVAPFGLPRDTAEAVSLWVYFDSVAN